MQKKISGKLSFWDISLSFWEIFLSFKKNSLLWRHCCYIGVPIFFRNIEFLKNILEFFEKIAWVLVFLEFFIAWVFFENAKRQAWCNWFFMLVYHACSLKAVVVGTAFSFKCSCVIILPSVKGRPYSYCTSLIAQYWVRVLNYFITSPHLTSSS